MVEIKGELVWFVTGTSSGFGRELVFSALKRGDCVIATTRSLDKVKDFPKTEKLRLVVLDVTEGFPSIQEKVAKAVSFYGRIDVLVNNAGMGMIAMLEEGGSSHLRKQFDVNFFGTVDVTNAVLPHMRARRSGTIVIIGSRTSWAPEVLGAGSYISSKAAIRVYGETLNTEITPLGLRTLIIEPGAFRTSALEGDDYGGTHIRDYDELRETAGQRRKWARERLRGDPAKAMELLVDVVRGEGKAGGRPWPMLLPMGAITDDAIRAKTKKVLDILDEWQDVIRDMDLDEDK